MHKDKPVPHVHAEVIHAWADGQDIEFRFKDRWMTSNINDGGVISWAPKFEYRIKPKPPKVIELYAHAEFIQGTDISGGVPSKYLLGNFSTKFISTDSLKLSFCPMTGKLIAAEVVKYIAH